MLGDYGTQLNNIGFQLHSIGTQIKNLGIQSQNIYQQQLGNIGIEIYNIGTQIINFGMQMTNILNNMQNMNIQMINIFNQMQMANQMNQMMPQFENPNKEFIYRLSFQFNDGKVKYVNISGEKTVEELFKNFINENNLDDKNFAFLYNSSKLNINDKTKIKDSGIRDMSKILVYEYKENPA